MTSPLPETLTPVQVVLAVYRPDPTHLTAQLHSIAAQRGAAVTLVAVIADITSEELLRDAAQTAGIAPVVVRCDTPLDAVRAFEAGLVETTLTPRDEGAPEPLVALSDQDDIWHPDRLAEGIAALAKHPQVQLVHSDARLVAEDGETVVQKSVFAFERRHRNPGLRGLLYRNNITGMTVLMRADVVRLALPFPRQSGVHFYHDLWLGLIASATGGVHLIKKPLVDYRQHDGNVMGAVDRSDGWLRGTRANPRRINAMWLRREAAGYGLARYLSQALDQRLRDAIGAGTLDGALAQRRTRPLRPYLKQLGGAAQHLVDAAGLALRGNFGLARIATGFGIVNLGRSFWTVRMALSRGLREALYAFDMRLYSLSPGVVPRALERRQSEVEEDDVTLEDIIENRKKPRWSVALEADAPALTVLVPTLNPTEIFAGILTAIDIGLGLAARGHRVRFVATDLPVSSAAVSRGFLIQRLSAQDMASGTADRIALHCGVSSATLPGHTNDIYLATAWWSAHIARHLIDTNGLAQKKFFYLIQDFEPNFYAWGSEFADAMASYDLGFEPIFNTTLLREYFASQGFAFATADKLAFRPSIDISRYASGHRGATPERRRLALYGRPEVARNMYPIALEALADFIRAEELNPDQIELVSIGMAHKPVAMPRGVMLESLGKLPWDEYPTYLSGIDVGLSLMYSPHPSHPPIEMAASGVRVVTNTFGPKDLSVLSRALASVAPNTRDITAALSRAWHAGPVPDADRQVDMTPLGQTLDEMLVRLSATVDTLLPKTAAKPKGRHIILHIGSPKCGSTFLQNALLQNSDMLARAGINYPHKGDGHPGNAPDLADIDEAKLEKWFAGNTHTVILSHEDLYSLPKRGDALSVLTQAQGITVQLVVFMRPFSEFVYGDYSQFMKQYFMKFLAERTPYDGRTFYEFAQRRVDTMRPVMYLNNWQKRFTSIPLILAGHRNVVQVFSDLLPPHVADMINWTVPQNDTNQSLRMQDCDAIVEAIKNPDIPNSEIKKLYRDAFKNTGLPDAGRTPERTKWIEDHFAEHNKALMEVFSFDNRPRENKSTSD